MHEIPLGPLDVSLEIPEVRPDTRVAARLAPPSWSTLWSAGIAVAREIAAGPPLDGLRLCDLGCGLGLCAVIAALRGAQVTALDRSAAALRFTKTNLHRAGACADLKRFAFGATWAGEPFDRVIATDVTYDPRSLDLLRRSLSSLVAPGAGEIWLAYPHRDTSRAFADALRACGWSGPRATRPVRRGGHVERITIDRLRAPG